MSNSRLHAVCYLSAARRRLAPAEIDALLEQSRSRNLAHDVTGLLLYCDGSFMQYLEGPAHGLEPIWSSIRRDQRHSTVTTLFHEPIGERLFSGWSMGFRPTQPPELTGLLQADRIAPPAAGGVNPQVISLLLANFWRLNSA